MEMLEVAPIHRALQGLVCKPADLNVDELDTQMTTPEVFVVAIGWFGSLAGWLYEWRDKRRERAARETTEAELEVARNRADAAFFTDSVETFTMLTCGYNTAWLSANDNVLCWMRDAVSPDTAKGTTIVLPLANEGEDAKAVTFQKAGTPMQSTRYTDGDRGLWGIIEYPFDPGSFGKREIVEVRFESCNGFHRVHRYTMEHGRRRFCRIDPPLPSERSS
jgi:hypothetical protein